MLYPAGSGTRAMPSEPAPVLNHPPRLSSLRIVRSARFARSLKKNEVTSGGHSVPPLVAPRRPRRLERTRGRANLSTALAQGLPMCPERVRCVFGRDALLQPSCTRQDICWGKEPQWMRDRAGQARHVRNPELLQHPSQSRAARQQTPAPNWNATTLLSSHMLVACPAEPAPT
jgi:hypothetical protein